MNRYTWRSLILEISLILAAVVFFVPFVILASVALRDTNARSGLPRLHLAAELWKLRDRMDRVRHGPEHPEQHHDHRRSSVGLIIACLPLPRTRSPGAPSGGRRACFTFSWPGSSSPDSWLCSRCTWRSPSLGLVGSPLAVVLINVGGFLPFAIFLYSVFLRDLPKDYEEAATIDGARPDADVRVGGVPAPAPGHRHHRHPHRSVDLERLLHPAAVPHRQRTQPRRSRSTPSSASTARTGRWSSPP